MIRFELTVIGQNAVQNALRTTAAAAPRRMQNITYDWAQMHVIRRLVVKAYPPERPGQKYIRTRRLQARWYAEPQGKSVLIANRQPYAGYVVGDSRGKGQAWMHRNRWWLAADVVKDARPELGKMITRELDHMLKVSGGVRG